MSEARFFCKHGSRIFAVVLVLTLLLCGCKAGEETQKKASKVTATDTANAASVTLPFTATDSLNPYEAKTKTNQELSRLLYDGLITLDGNTMQAEYSLAREIIVKGTLVTVKLRSARFTDGSMITAQDVLFSMDKAMKAEALSYGEDFSNVASKAVSDSGELRIQLKHEDANFINFLDFPVYKAESEERKNEDNKVLPPVGGGRYEYHELAGKYWLTANKDWWGGKIGIPRIELLNLPDEDAVAHAVQVGMVSWYYSDLSDNTFPGMNGVSKAVALPNLVYLGCNLTSGVTANQAIRRGISAALDRKNIVENAYFGVAKTASGAFPDGVEAASGLQTISASPDDEQAGKFFADAGYRKKNADGYLTTGSTTLRVKVIYNKDNTARGAVAQAVSERLGYLGCKVTVEALTWAQYKAAISAGHYDLYVGEMRLPDNLDLYPLLTAGGLLHPDVSAPKTGGGKSGGEDADDVVGEVMSDEPILSAAQAAYRYHTGKGSLTEVLSCVNYQFPIIPVCHRNGMLIYDRAVKGTPTPIMGDPFCGIEKCTVGS